MELYEETSVLARVLVGVFNAVLETGKLPESLLRILLVPLLKPGGDPGSCSSRRPIALIGTAIKILEGVLYQRILPVVEPQLEPGLYAYRRNRGTEMVLMEIMDSVRRGLNRGRFVYIVSFYVRGPFDSVPHHRLMAAMKEFGMDPNIRRVVHGWLRSRTFQVRLRAHGEVYKSSVRSITRALPQGGTMIFDGPLLMIFTRALPPQVLSPLLWTMFFDGVIRHVNSRVKAAGLETEQLRNLIYADDITSLISSETEEQLRKLAWAHQQRVREAL